MQDACHMNSVKWLCSPSRSSVDGARARPVFWRSWIGFMSGTQLFSLFHARVMLINSPFTLRFVSKRINWKFILFVFIKSRNCRLMNMMEDFSLLSQVCFLSFSRFTCVSNALVFNFSFDVVYPYISCQRMTYSSDPFLKRFWFVHLFKSELDELPERLPATPCNVLESLQPVNQLEAGIADESAGELPFLLGGILSYFFLIFLKIFTVFCVLKCYSLFCPTEKWRLLQAFAELLLPTFLCSFDEI